MDKYYQVTMPGGLTTVIWATSRGDLIRWMDKQRIQYTKIVELV